MSEIYTNSQGDGFELQMWEEVKKDFGYPDNNKGYIYGCHPIDENGEIIDCNWFKTNEERYKLIREKEEERMVMDSLTLAISQGKVVERIKE